MGQLEQAAAIAAVEQVVEPIVAVQVEQVVEPIVAVQVGQVVEPIVAVQVGQAADPTVAVQVGKKSEPKLHRNCSKRPRRDSSERHTVDKSCYSKYGSTLEPSDSIPLIYSSPNWNSYLIRYRV